VLLASLLVASASAAAAQDGAEGLGEPVVTNLPPLSPLGRLSLGGGAPLGVEEVQEAAQARYPGLLAAEQKRVAAEGKLLEAEGSFDLSLVSKSQLAAAGYYRYLYSDVGLEQPLQPLGASIYGGYRLGSGKIPVYKGEYETLDGGELRLGVEVSLLQGRAIDARRAKLRQGAAKVEASEWALEVKRLEVGWSAAAAYWGWVASGERYRVALEALELAESREGQIEAQIQAGKLPAAERLENRRAVLGRRQQLIKAQRKLEASALKLSLYLRDAAGAPVVPGPERLPARLEPPPPLQGDALQGRARALDLRPELRELDAMREGLRVELELADNAQLPQLDVGVEASQDVGPGSGDASKRLGPTAVLGGVAVKWPVQQRKARGQSASARAALEQLELDGGLLRDQIGAEVADVLSAIQAADEQVTITRDGWEISGRAAEAERRRFALGSTDLLKVNILEQYAADTHLKHIDALEEAWVERARWRAVTVAP
jgi:cobalt-zinc-cadmium efflux system outer membrane protein